jgi:hypothetical protein
MNISKDRQTERYTERWTDIRTVCFHKEMNVLICYSVVIVVVVSTLPKLLHNQGKYRNKVGPGTFYITLFLSLRLWDVMCNFYLESN